MAIFCGIDPGKSGCLCVLTNSTPTFFDWPKDDNIITYFRHLENTFPFDLVELAILEKVHAMPKQGVTSMFNFGLGYGAIVALATVSTARLVLVTPQIWKKHVLAGTNKDKDAAIQFCNHTYPNVNLILPRCRNAHDGMADAICLAHYGAHYVK